MHTLTGKFRHHHSFHSSHLPDDRDVIVYLPPDYDSAPGRRYPVLYFHDGQNVFDSETAFAGHEWGADETAEALITEGAISPLIMVGIYNTGVNRIQEYTPTTDSHGQSGGKADAYASMLIEDLKPFIDGEYRTLADNSNTGMVGSSLGGLVTLYIGLRHPEVFGKLAVLSPSIWWDHRVILRLLRDVEHHPRTCIWLDVGTREGKQPESVVRDARYVRDLLLKKGWTMGHDFVYYEDEGAGHDERAWGNRLHQILRYLFGHS